MSKVKPEQMKTSGNKKMPQSKVKHKKIKKKKNLKNMEVSSKVKIKNALVLPPKDCQDFSANWRKLQETLKKTSQSTQQDTDLGSSEKSVHKKAIKDIVVKKTHEKMSVPLQKGKVPVQRSGAQKRKAVDPQIPVAHSSSQKDKKIKVKEETEKKISEGDIWFDDVDPEDIEITLGKEAADIARVQQGLKKSNSNPAESSLVKAGAFEGLTRVVAIDCEMVGVGPDGQDSILARVSLVNQFGKCIYDKYVKPTERVTDYRTGVSGIRPQDVKHGEDIKAVQKEVADILKGRLLVGHAIHNDLKILLLDHPKKYIRDTQKYKPFRKIAQSSRPSLKLLCEKVLNVNVQQGEHSSVQDAQATMRLYTLVKKQWEASVKRGLRNGEIDRNESACKPCNKTSAAFKKSAVTTTLMASV